MRTCLACLCTCFLGCAVPAAAGTCGGWSGGPSLPRFHSGIVGRLCHLAGPVCWVAGDDLVAYDVADVGAPTELGRAALPAPAVGLAVTGGLAYVTCGAAGLVEVDLADPWSPRIARTLALDAADAVAAAPGRVAVVAGGTTVHVVDVSGAGDLAVAASWAAGSPCGALAFCSGRLVVARSEVVVLDVDGPGDPVVLDTAPVPDLGAGPLAVVGERVYVAGAWMSGWDGIRPNLQAYDLAGDGTLVPAGTFSRADGAVQALDGHLLLGTEVRSVPDLDPVWRLERGGSCAAADGRIAAIDAAAGLTLWEGSLDAAVRADTVLAHDGTGDWRAPHVYSGTLSESYGGSGGGYTRTLDYRVFDLTDPLSPVVVAERQHSVNYGVDGYASTVGLGVRAPAWYTEATWTATVDGVYESLAFRALPGGALFGAIAGAHAFKSDDATVWQQDLATGDLVRYRVEPGVGIAAEAAFPLAAGDPEAAVVTDPELLVLPAGFEYFAYGIATPDSLPLLGSVAIAAAAGPPVTLGVASGRRIVVADAAGGTFVLDFADPADPVARPGPALPAAPRISVFRDDCAVLLYESAWQLAAVTAAGDFVLLSGALPAPTTRYLSAVWEDDVVYCATATAVHAYATTVPAAPAFLGQAMIAGGSLGVQAGRLVAGRHVYPPPCDASTAVRERRIEPRLLRGDPCGSPPGRCELAVMTERDIDASGIVISSVALGDRGVGPAAWVRTDVDADGDLDLVLVFAPGADAGPCRDGVIGFQARLADGTLVRGAVAAGGGARAPGFGPAGLVVRLAPNPFNPRLTVAFVLERAGPVRATVHDLRGRRLAVLADGQRESGSHEVAWDGRDERGRAAAAGTYVVRFATDRGLQAVKAVLLR